MAIRDELPDFLGLVAWAVAMGMVTAPLGELVLQEAERGPIAPLAVLARLHFLRNAIYRAFWAISRRKPIPAADPATIQAEFANVVAHATLAESGTKME